MLRGLFIAGAVLAVFGASLWQLLLKDFVYVTLGVGRIVQTLDEFPYTCRHIADERLSACEDLWLDDEARVLYAACATTQGRLAWNPSVNRANISARRPSGTSFLALSIDSSLPDGSFPLREIKAIDYVGAAGDSSADYLGFDGDIIDKETIHFYFVNQRPPVDAQLKYIDASYIGANSTIEVFEHKRGESVMKHLKTVWDPDAVWTPNKVAAVGKGAFVVTNDHSRGIGWRKALDYYIGGDSGVAYCSPTGTCSSLTPPRTFRMPNGLVRGADGLIYVPDSIMGTISVYSLVPNDTTGDSELRLVHTIHVGMPLDNLALDANGDLWGPGFADGVALLKWTEDPLATRVPGTVWRIRKVQDSYELDKVIEDGEARILNGITTAVHDVKTGRLFLGSVVNEFAVCEPKA